MVGLPLRALPERLAAFYRAGLPILFIITRDPSTVASQAYQAGLPTVWVWGGARPFAAAGPLPAGFQGVERYENLPLLSRLPWPGPSLGVVTGFPAAGPDLSYWGDLLDSVGAEIRSRQTPLLLCVVLGGDLPEEYRHIGPVLRVQAPDQAERMAEIARILHANGYSAPDDQIAATATALAGLELSEVRQVALSQLSLYGQLDSEMAGTEKSRRLVSGGLLEPISGRSVAVGGLVGLKAWLHARARAVRERGLPMPKGIVLVGPPGTGKSLSAQMVAGVLGLPLVRLDVGRLFGAYVGETEKNLRLALNQAEALAPVILWVDEIEKGLAGSGANGSDITRRMLQTLLSWVQEQSGVFIFATANDVQAIPPELLRKGRFDQLFYVDLPQSAEREEIWIAALDRWHLDPARHDIVALVAASDGFTGAEISAAVADAVYESDMGPTTDDLLRVIRATRPLSQVFPDQIAAIRAWGAAHARPAGGHTDSTSRAERLRG